MTARKTLAILALVVSCAGCSQSSNGQSTRVDTEPTVEPTTELSDSETPAASAAENSAPAESDQTTEDRSETDEPLDGQINVNIVSGNEISNDIYAATITGIRFTPVDSAKDAIAEAGLNPEPLFEPDIQTVIGIGLEGENRSNDLLRWHPGQSAIVIGSEQLDSDLFLSDYLAPSSDWRPGVKSDGIAVYKSTQAIDELSGSGQLTFIMKPARDTDYGELVPEQDLAITFSQP